MPAKTEPNTPASDVSAKASRETVYTDLMTVSQAAAWYAENLGWAVVPFNTRRGADGKMKKGPATPHGYKDATSDPEGVGRLWAKFPGPCVAVSNGAPSGGLVSMDLDRGHAEGVDGVEGLREWLRARGLGWPETLQDRTPSGGMHLYFTDPAGKLAAAQGCGRAVGAIPGVDLLAAGGCILPPSKRSDGAYSWVPGRSPADMVPAELPAWALELAGEYKAKRKNKEGKGGAGAGAWDGEADIPKGTRNEELNRYAFALACDGEPLERIRDLVRYRNLTRCKPPLDGAEVDAILASATKGAEPREVRPVPLPVNLGEVWDSMPELAPELIQGVLRCGHKMLICAPSKAGKSYALIELCGAIASGGAWLGRRCMQGRVLYVNLEIDPASCLQRFRKVCECMGVAAAFLGNVSIWSLRGHALTLDRLAPLIVQRVAQMEEPPLAVIVDPIYKVMLGDENNASDMGAFTRWFDVIAEETGASVIYCHHQSKGAQGGKSAMDRASGSGVFARDPDALVDISELVLSRELRERHPARATAWRCTWVLREFADPGTCDMWFEWPLHVLDGAGELKEMGVRGSAAANRTEGTNATKGGADGRWERINGALGLAVMACESEHVPATRENVLERIDEDALGEEVTLGKLRSWTREGERRAMWHMQKNALGVWALATDEAPESAAPLAS